MDRSRIAAVVLKSVILFLQHVWGTVQHPYETYRNLSAGKNIGQAIPLFLLCLLYFSWTSLVRTGIRAHPLLVSFNVVKVTAASLVTFALVVVALVVAGKLFGGKGSVKSVLLPWTYSLLPTLLWFFMTSVLWIVFPPPRTEAFAGKALSLLFLAISWFLFFWKGVLYYLTLRFGMKLDLVKILSVSALLFPLGILYSILMYKMGIFRIPFL
jgi:hypothetical protein